MSNEQSPLQSLTAKDFFNKDSVKNKFKELLGRRAPQFITSVLQIVASNDLLSKADPASIYQSAAVAATLDLPLNNSLGFAYIVPFNTKQKDGTYKTVAQFQIGAKGFKQLALRTSQFITINDSDVREGELKSNNRLTGEIKFEWIQDEVERNSKKIVGYVSYFKLINGFEKTKYMTIEELNAHGVRFSQTFKKGYGLWKDDFPSMCLKTVTKLNLSKDAPLSIDLQNAITFDQGIISNAETKEVEYPDNEPQFVDAELVSEEKENEMINEFISKAKTAKQLSEVQNSLKTPEQTDLFNSKLNELTNGTV